MLIISLAVALGAALLLLLLIEPGSGVADVQVTGAARPLLEAHHALLRPGEPWVVGRGIGRVPQRIAFFLQAATLIAAGVGIWALAKRRKRVGWLAAAYLGLIEVAGPIPTTMQPMPPVAIDAATARRLLATGVSDEPAYRYMKAQLAYLDGDHAGAATLVRALDAEQLHSPIEARYRLQFLRGGPIVTTSVCFKFGCLAPAKRHRTQGVALLLLIAGIAVAAGAGWLEVTLRRRVGRIDQMSVHRGRRLVV